MLLKRLITAIILIPVVLGAIIYLSPLSFSVVAGLLMLVGAWEWAGLMGFTQFNAKMAYLILILLGLLFSVFFNETSVLLLSAIVWIWAFFAIKNYQREGQGLGFQLPMIRGLIGLIVLVSTWVAMVTLKTYPDFGPGWLITVLLIIWAADVGAYFAGRSFGHRSLCSRVSPKKTIEGFIGGTILSILVAMFGGLFLSLSAWHYVGFVFLGVITSLFSVVGDLTVSLLKRMSNIKDSGNIFPGHGGMLDRMDSVAASMAIFVLGALILGV